MIALALALAQVAYPGVTPDQLPPMCADAPAADTYTGSTGTGAPCVHRSDATRPTQTQAKDTTIQPDGTFADTWPVPFPAVPTSAHASIYGQNQPFTCGITTKTATGFTGKCWALTSTTLPSTLTGIQNLVVSPVQNAAAGLTVTVTGRL